jgi:hypothetical protein
LPVLLGLTFISHIPTTHHASRLQRVRAELTVSNVNAIYCRSSSFFCDILNARHTLDPLSISVGHTPDHTSYSLQTCSPLQCSLSRSCGLAEGKSLWVKSGSKLTIGLGSLGRRTHSHTANAELRNPTNIKPSPTPQRFYITTLSKSTTNCES